MNINEQRKKLYKLVSNYLNSKKTDVVTKDKILFPTDFDSNHFLMFLALLYPKDRIKSIYSIDLEIDDITRYNFINHEYDKINGIKNKDEIQLGKIILDDSHIFYQNISQEDTLDNAYISSHEEFKSFKF